MVLQMSVRTKLVDGRPTRPTLGLTINRDVEYLQVTLIEAFFVACLCVYITVLNQTSSRWSRKGFPYYPVLLARANGRQCGSAPVKPEAAM